MSRVSLVVPVFNAAPFLAAAVSSVMRQTCGDWELILVDDGSTDDSRVLCEEYARTDARIRLLTQANKGPAAARNAGVRAATGEFVCFLDADDRLYDDALETLLQAADHFDADIVLGNFSKQEGDGTPIPQPVVFQPDGAPFHGEAQVLTGRALIEYLRHFLTCPSNHLVSYCWARLYRRSVMQTKGLAANEEMRLFEDFAFNLDYMAATQRLVFVNKPVYVYVLRPSHASASMAVFNARQLVADMESFRCKVDGFLDALTTEPQLAAAVRREVGHTLVHYAIIFLVRASRQIDAANRKIVLHEIDELVRSPILQSSLPCYRPRPGNSRLVPWLMRLKFPRLIAEICKLKGRRRYGQLQKNPT